MESNLLPLEWHNEKRKVKDLVPFEFNPRKLSEEKKQLLINSIEKFNLAEVPAINLDNVIIAGHQRIKVLMELGRGEEEIDVRVPNRLLTDKEYKEYNITSNIPVGFWDVDVLEENFQDIDLEELGLIIDDGKVVFEDYDKQESNVKVLEAEEDDFDTTPPEQPITVMGDLYEIGQHRLICGDSTQTDTFEKLMQGELADMVVTDPPYNVALGMETKEQAKARNRRTDGLIIKNDKMSKDEFYKFLYDFFTALSTVVKKGGSIYVWYASSEVVNFAKAMVDGGWLYKQELIWNKNSMIMGRQDYQWKHEPCLYGWLDGGSHNWYSDRKQTTVIEWDKPSRNGEHPTMKPVGLFGYQIKNSSKENEIVIDAFGGSGTTMVACEQLNRKARIVEFDPKYCDVIVRRMIKLDPSISVKRNGVDCKSEFE